MVDEKNLLMDFIEKKHPINKIWEESERTCSEETREDFLKLVGRIIKDGEKSKRLRIFLHITLGSVACLAIIFLSSIVTWKMKDVDYLQVSAPRGESITVSLPDKSVLVLQPGSSAVYPEIFRSGTRTVFLTGTADFIVASDPDKSFIVKTQYMDVEALGTRFRVQAHLDDFAISTTLIEGKVKVDVKKDSVKSFMLEPGNQIKYIPSQNDIQLLDISASRMASWESGYLVFQKATFTEIAQSLERRYDVEINYDSGALRNDSFFIRFHPDETLSEALDMLVMLIPGSQYRISENRVYFQIK